MRKELKVRRCDGMRWRRLREADNKERLKRRKRERRRLERKRREENAEEILIRRNSEWRGARRGGKSAGKRLERSPREREMRKELKVRRCGWMR